MLLQKLGWQSKKNKPKGKLQRNLLQFMRKKSLFNRMKKELHLFLNYIDIFCSELIHVQKELNTALANIKATQENYETQSAAWQKEKTDLQVTPLPQAIIIFNMKYTVIESSVCYRARYQLCKIDFVVAAGRWSAPGWILGSRSRNASFALPLISLTC